MSSLKDDSFASLLVKYGVASSLTGSADGVNYNIAEAPLYFVRSGRIYLPAPRPFYYAGQNGGYWSSAPSPSGGSAYNLNYSLSGVNLSNNNNRFDGDSLRCLAS